MNNECLSVVVYNYSRLISPYTACGTAKAYIFKILFSNTVMLSLGNIFSLSHDNVLYISIWISRAYRKQRNIHL